METIATSPFYFIYIFQYHSFIKEIFQSCHIQTLPLKKFMNVGASLRDSLLGFPKNRGKYAFALG